MQMGNSGLGHAWGHDLGHGKMRAAMQGGETSGLSRGERLVARQDGDGDGKLSLGELEGTKLGRRLTVDQFIKLDANADGMLDAQEFDGARGARGFGAGSAESALRSNMADYLMAKVGDDALSDVASRVIRGLDADGSGALNSEEIAGTRLAEMIGDGFYALDADRTGGLDRAELSGFIAEHLMASASDGGTEDAGGVEASVTEDGADIAATTGDREVADVTDVGGTASGEKVVDAPQITASASSDLSVYAAKVQSAFEAALEVLKQSEAGEGYSVVSALYADVQSIFDTA